MQRYKYYLKYANILIIIFGVTVKGGWLGSRYLHYFFESVDDILVNYQILTM